jgi:hypothetical protein
MMQFSGPQSPLTSFYGIYGRRSTPDNAAGIEKLESPAEQA